MADIRYRNNPIPAKCRLGRKMRDDIDGHVVYEDFLVPNADGQMVDVRNRRTLDERPDLPGPNIAGNRG